MATSIPDSIRFFTLAMKARRLALGLTQQQVADASGLTLGTVNQIENGRRYEADIVSLEKIAQSLGGNLESFVWMGREMADGGASSFRKELGRVLADLRSERGLSQNAAATRAEMSPSYLKAIEEGSSSMTIDKLFNLTRVYGVEAYVPLKIVFDNKKV